MLALLVCESYGQGPSTSQDALPCDLLKLDSLVGTVSLSLGSDTVVRKAMPCLLSLWQQHKNLGSGQFYVSNAFLAVMQENPTVFFSVMANEGRIFSEWLDELQDLSFTWSFPPPCGKEAKRQRLISLLQHHPIQDSTASALKNRIISKLSTIRCRQIN